MAIAVGSAMSKIMDMATRRVVALMCSAKDSAMKPCAITTTGPVMSLIAIPMSAITPGSSGSQIAAVCVFTRACRDLVAFRIFGN